jgi:hypothetical protein
MTAMNNDQLAARAKLILHELRVREPSILQSWMTQYVAECLAAAEVAPLTAPVRDTCASAIAQLWKLCLEERKHHTARAIDTFRFRSSLNDDTLAALKAELSDESSDAIRLGPEAAVQLRHLALLEEHLLEVLWAATAVVDDHKAPDNADVGSDAKLAELLSEFREETKLTSQRIAAAVFPEFGTLALNDQPAVLRVTEVALRKVDRARRRRLWKNEEVPGNGESATTDHESDTPRDLTP